MKFSNNGGAAYNSDGTNPDDVKITLNYKKATEGDDDKTALSPANPGTLQILATDLDFQTAGKLVLIVTINSDDVSSNYAFDESKNNPDRQEFTVDSASVNSSFFVWEYISDKAGATTASWTTSSELKFAYKNPDVTNTDTSGLTYTFNLKMAGTKLDGYTYISVDTARTGFTNGYKLEKWDEDTNAWVAGTAISEVGKYRITAALVIDASDTEHSFTITANDGTETKSKEGEAALEIEVKKGTFDLSGVKWGYTKNGRDVEYTEAFAYNGGNQSIQLINLPKGLTITGATPYTDNKKQAVGKYTAKLTSGLNAVSSFEKPVISDNTSVFEKEWEIVKGKVEEDWTTDERSAGESHVFYLPVYADSSATYVEVKYYVLNGDGTRGEEVADGAIEFDPDNPKKYVAVMKIKDTETDNYDLVNETGAVIAEATYEFSPGADKIPVKITVSHIDGIETYNG
ncbi:MAG: hypothetical protein K2J30_06365, partial [Clostridia bacterium]|nr:hypothetical protein [Clostridia bacterium]